MTTPEPRKGEVWSVGFNPTTGAEIAKTRPAVVISENSIGKLPLRIVVPITDWKPRFQSYPWFTLLKPTRLNGLTKESGADAFQVKSLSLDRFAGKAGRLTASQVQAVVDAVGLCIGF